MFEFLKMRTPVLKGPARGLDCPMTVFDFQVILITILISTVRKATIEHVRNIRSCVYGVLPSIPARSWLEIQWISIENLTEKWKFQGFKSFEKHFRIFQCEKKIDNF